KTRFHRSFPIADCQVPICPAPACAINWQSALAIGNDLFGIIELDDRERSSLWIVQDRKAADAGNVFGRLHYTATEFSDFLHFRVAIVDCKVNQPVWRDWSHFLTDLVHAAGASIAVLDSCVSD